MLFVKFEDEGFRRMSEPNRTPALYNKADTLRGITSSSDERDEVRTRLERIDLADVKKKLGAYKSSIVEKAVLDALAPPDTGIFQIKNHIVAEIQALRDEELPRYLFYRYRYDLYPELRQLDEYPPCVQLEVTSVCNFRCVFCYQINKDFTRKSNGHMGHMPLDRFKNVVDQLAGNVEAVTIASRGEPLLCKDFGEMLEYASSKFLGFKINTNASLLSEDLAHAILSADVNTVVFSADAADEETYSTLRVGGRLSNVFANVSRFNEIRSRDYPNSRTITRVSGVKVSEQQDYNDMTDFWSDCVDQVAFVDYNPWENAYDSASNGITTPCSDLWRRMFIWWDGRVNPCDVDFRSTLSVGTIDSLGVSGAWRSQLYETLRNGHEAAGRQAISPCSGCAVV